MKYVAWLVGLLLIHAAGAQTVNRCVIDGQTVFQEAPCPGALGTAWTADHIKKNARPAAAPRLQVDERKRAEKEAEAARAREKLLDPCGGIGFDDRVEKYLRDNPKMKDAVDRVMRSGEAYIGMPEEMLEVFICGSIETKNILRTANGTDIQIVMKGRVPIFAKYIYIRNGVVYATQW